MFSLSGATKFKYIPNYKDMRGGYDKLRGVVSALDGRMEELKDFNNAAGKMKELWFYMGPGFREAGRQLKSIKKARTYDEYRAATDWLFSSCSLSEDDNRNSFFLDQ